MMASESALPIELCYIAISHLEEDESSLQACSLTCRAWTLVSRRLLFTRTWIIEDKPGRALRDMDDDISRPPVRGAGTLADFVQELQISGLQEEPVGYDEGHPPHPDLDLGLLWHVLGRLPRLDSLDFWRVSFAGEVPPDIKPLHLHLLGLQEIGGCTFAPSQFVSMLGLFGFVEHMRYGAVTFAVDYSNPEAVESALASAAALATPLQVDQLSTHVPTASIAFLSQLLARLPLARTVFSLRASLMLSTTIAQVGELVLAGKSNILHLQLELLPLFDESGTPPPPPEQLFAQLNLPACTTMRSIVFTTGSHWWDIAQADTRSLVSHAQLVLLNTAPRSAQVVGFRFVVQEPTTFFEHAAALSWGAKVSVLSDMRLIIALFEFVMVTPSPPDMRARCEQLLRDNLDPLVQRSLVWFNFRDKMTGEKSFKCLDPLPAPASNTSA